MKNLKEKKKQNKIPRIAVIACVKSLNRNRNGFEFHKKKFFLKTVFHS